MRRGAAEGRGTRALSRLSRPCPAGPAAAAARRELRGAVSAGPSPVAVSAPRLPPGVNTGLALSRFLPLPAQTAGSRRRRHLFYSLRDTQHPLPHLTRDRDGGKLSNVSIRAPDSTRLLTGRH